MTKSLKDLAHDMRSIDICMLSTRAENGAIAARPMSNNTDVEYDGDSWFYTSDDTRMVDDILRDPNVSLSFQSKKMMVKPFSIAVEGKGEIIRDKQIFREHWNKDLDRWFEQGVDTPGLVMIKVHADRIAYWEGEENGEITLN